jgi:Tat protein secretion system quality control protein TatD with DNase activity
MSESSAFSDQPLIPWSVGVHDAHCHPTDTMDATASIPSMKAGKLAIMGTHTHDQQLVAQLARSYPDRIAPSFGYHPWFSHMIYDDSQKEEVNAEEHYSSVLTPVPDKEFMEKLPPPRKLSEIIAEICENLEEFPKAMVGEIGLDRAFRLPIPNEQPKRLSKYHVSMDHQRIIFLAQLRLAGEMRRGVSVHGVQCHGVIFDTLKVLWAGYERKVERSRDRRRRRRKVAPGVYEILPDINPSDESEPEDEDEPKPYPPRICLHSFSAPIGVLKQYLSFPAPSRLWFSFSTTINAREEKGHLEKVKETIKELPEECVLVESDLHTAGNEMDEALENAVRFVCGVRGWSIEEGTRKLAENFKAYIGEI